ncbi:hypothetical protein DUI87_19176 [Hirundo rustica rustica]|uniref:RNA-directed DNA polymerase n=1 Tax=Hirundo rustica rustica TaxID=333673 RepID=A0A3M0KB14_HIRRU|nr:hypothetical protein DUI87_19176 [Hirundo rustica rustica]
MEPNSEYFVIGDTAHTPLEVEVAPMTIKGKITGLMLLARCMHPPFYLTEGQVLAQAIPVSAEVLADGKSPEVYWAEVVGENKPSLACNLAHGSDRLHVEGVLDSGADITVIPESMWPSHWELQPVEDKVQRMPPWKYLGLQIAARTIVPQKLEIECNPKTLADLHSLGGSLNWAKLSHQQYHQNVPGLIRQFQLTRSQARAIVATCPNFQVQAMGAVYASAHAREKTEHAKKHLVQAFSVLGIPKEIKTDNGPAYTSKGFLEFLQQWGVEHKTGIPHSPTGQAVVERAHQTLKQVLAGQSSTTVWMSPHEKLCKAMFTINFLNCSFENMSPPVVRHFNSGNQFKLSQRPPVMIKDPETRETKGPYELVTWGRGYACVATPSGPRWIPQEWVKPFVPKNPAPAEGDKRQVAVASKRRRHRMEEKESS